MKSSAVRALALTVLILTTLSLHAAVTLVEKGQPKAVIVVADPPSPAAGYAAKELRLHIKKVTGADLPIARESKITDDETRAIVLVGDSRFAKALGAETATLDPESTLVRTSGNRLLIIGGDRGAFTTRRYGNACGTIYAVYDFLESELGIRWLWPGEVGTVIPKRHTVTVGDVDRAFAPPLVKRNIRHGLHDRSGTLARLGRTQADMARISLDWGKWTRRRRVGRRANFAFGHAFNHWLDKYGKEHPDWFAMMLNGERVTPEKPYPGLERAKLCVTNEELLDFIARRAMGLFEKNPARRSFSVCPNDSRGYCMCPKCKALDHPDGILDEVNYPGVTDMRYPSLSDRYVWFWNQIAKRIAPHYPDHYLGAYAYSNYRFPPLREKLSPNVVISYVGFNYLNAGYTVQSRKDWAGWVETGCKMFLRPNLLLAGHGFPVNYSHELAADLKECYRTGMLGTDFDSMTHHYAGQAPIFYMLTSLLWNPEKETEAILDDFMASAYGSAAPVMRRYWDRIEKITTETANTIGNLSKTDAHDNAPSLHQLVPTIYSDTVLGELRALIAEARKAAVGRPDILARLDVASVGLEYAEVQRNVLTGVKAYNDKTDRDLDHLVPALERKDAFFRKHIRDRTIGLSHVGWREFRNSRVATAYGTALLNAHVHPRRLTQLLDWKFITDPENQGEATGYHQPAFDDSSWATLSTTSFWEKQGYKDYDGYAWYRRTLSVPAQWKKRDKIILLFGAVDESFRLYIDGKLVREWLYDGTVDPELWRKPRPVDITEHLSFGGKHTLAVRVHDSGGGGGIWKTAMVVYE